MITSQDVKRAAKAMGADMVGIGSIDRWEGVPVQMDPRQIMPEAKSVVGMVFRVMRGSLRGVEEGTYFSNYSAMGYGGITYLYMPMTVINLAKMIEDEGYEAVPYGHQSDWRGIDNEGRLRRQGDHPYSRPVAPGRAFPDVMIHLRFAAFLCGLGEIGYSKMFLSPRFGPRNRVGVIITDAPLEPDPLYDGPPLCDQCMACVKNCPGNAIDPDKTVKVNLAGREIEWGELDCNACGIAFRGAVVNDDLPASDSYDTYDEMYGHHTEPAPWSPFYRKPRNLYNTGQAVCGGRGCVRACMMNLEARGVLENKFHSPFRRRKPWRVDWSQPAPEASPDEISEVTGQEAD